MAQTKVKLISDGVIDVGHLASGHGITTDNIGEGSNLYYTDARVSTYLSTNSYATEGYVTTAVANLVDSAPTTLDTLNELAAALGDDPNFATTVTNSIATKLPLAGGNITGTLGIGTASILSGNKLDVRGGNIMVGGYGTGVDYGLIFTPADSSSYWHIYNDTSGALAFGRHATIGSSEHLRIDSAGNVGIGTTSPSNRLHVVDTNPQIRVSYNSPTDSRYAELSWFGLIGNASDTANNSFNIGMYGGSSTEGKLHFKTGPSTDNQTRMTIDRSGNVGIGTTSPSSKLTVSYTSDGDGLEIKNSNRGGSYQLATSGVSAQRFAITDTTNSVTNAIFGYDRVTLYTGTSTSVDARLYIDASGNIGLGTTSPGNYNGAATTKVLAVGDTSGNNGVNIVSGTTSTGSYMFSDSGGNDRGGITYYHTADLMTITTSGSEAVRILSDGNFGIGTTSPYLKLDVAGGIRATGSAISTAGAILGMYSGGTSLSSSELILGSTAKTGWGPTDELGTIRWYNVDGSGIGPRDAAKISAFCDVGNGSSTTTFSGALAFYTSLYNDTVQERMRITSGGDVLINTTSGSAENKDKFVFSQGNGWVVQNHSTSRGDGSYFNLFYYGTTNIGSIRQSGTTGVNYNTSSDYRLKENVVEMTGALDRVDALKPSRFNFIADPEKTVDGFLAHEVAEVVPEAISGEKDAVDEEGNPIYQGIDQSKIVPLLVGAIKELKAEVEALKQQLNG